MSTTTKKIIFEENKGNYFVETLSFDESSSNIITCERLIFSTDSGLTDRHSIRVPHIQPELLLIKGRL